MNGRMIFILIIQSVHWEKAEKNKQIPCISPGGVDTNFVAKLKDRIGIETLNNIHPTKKIADADEIAVYIKFLVENATSFMTGSEIFIDGGYSAQ
jgi:NAD(P)-dependent dehydrogenase (short-subunit alcohol dehydrogenase family)